MKVVILAGGVGTRLSEETMVTPKPMVRIGPAPILWHIMKIYTHWGFNEFVVALGYKAETIKSYFIDYRRLNGDLTVNLGRDTVTQARRASEDWIIHLIDTGCTTLTGGRLRRLQHILRDETFMLTYGDGVTDADINKVIAHHRNNQGLATITAVRPPVRFGGITFDGPLVASFAEKRQVDAGWINGGFMVMEPGCFDYLTRDEDVLEVDLLERLAHDKKLAAYRHEGFWQCMDTVRDRQILEKMWASGEAPWKVWSDET